MITQGYLARHFQGRSGMRDPALLDVAQDYALKHLHDQGAFELGIVLKGGTSLRKLRAGNAGRFSTDLDFLSARTPRAISSQVAQTSARARPFAHARLLRGEHTRNSYMHLLWADAAHQGARGRRLGRPVR
jgi:hypothetical protein